MQRFIVAQDSTIPSNMDLQTDRPLPLKKHHPKRLCSCYKCVWVKSDHEMFSSLELDQDSLDTCASFSLLRDSKLKNLSVKVMPTEIQPKNVSKFASLLVSDSDSDVTMDNTPQKNEVPETIQLCREVDQELLDDSEDDDDDYVDEMQ